MGSRTLKFFEIEEAQPMALFGRTRINALTLVCAGDGRLGMGGIWLMEYGSKMDGAQKVKKRKKESPSSNIMTDTTESVVWCIALHTCINTENN